MSHTSQHLQLKNPYQISLFLSEIIANVQFDVSFYRLHHAHKLQINVEVRFCVRMIFRIAVADGNETYEFRAIATTIVCNGKTYENVGALGRKST